MLKEKGFTLVEGLLIVLVVAVLGLGGYYVWSQQQSDTPTESQESVQENNNEEPQEEPEESSDIPSGFELYRNEEYGFEFIHPESWGMAEVTEYTPEHNGQQYFIGFSDTEVAGAIVSADFEYTGPGRGGGNTEILEPNYVEAVDQYATNRAIYRAERSFIGTVSFCEYSGQLLLRLHVEPRGSFSHMTFTYPHNVELGFDCIESANEDSDLSVFFDEGLIEDFKTMAAYEGQLH